MWYAPLLATLIASASVASASSSTLFVGRASVIDADTIEIHGQRIRLHGVDAPEAGQNCLREDATEWRCGQSAAIALSNKLGALLLSCAQTDIDQYERVVAVCTVNSEDISAWLVSEGWALAYRRYSLDYVSEEENAKVLRLGLWSGTFALPWDYRRAQLPVNVNELGNDGCVIKGNINSAGEKIYHVPGGRFYQQTRVNPGSGEHWFCSEEEAISEGWRRSSQ